MTKIISVFLGVLFLLTVKIQAQTSQQNVLIEVFTAAWSGYAPDSFVILESTLTNNPNSFAINVHHSDGMAFSDGELIADYYGAAYPQAVINRDAPPISRNSWNGATNTALLGTSIVSVSFDSVRYNSSSGLLDIYLKAVFSGAASGDMRFNCVLVEDSVSGTGTGYDQVNYDNTTSGHYYEGAGNPILGLYHRYVARSFIGGPWGVSGSIPASVSNGTITTYHLSTIVSSTYDNEQLSLIGIVNEYGATMADREILNVEKCYSLFPPQANFSSTANTICKGESIDYTNLSTNYATSWYWEFEGGNPATSTLENPGTINYPHGGTFYTKLTSTGIAGSDMQSMVIVVDSVNIQILQTDTSFIAQLSGASYQWFDCDGMITPLVGETSQEFVIQSNGYYSVEINDGTCVDTSACMSILNLSIDESQILDLYVYPNPSNGEIAIESTEEGILEIINLSGQKILTYSISKGLNKLNLSLSSGMYYLSVITSKSVRTAKLVIE